jgi:hypothetical protein
MQEWMNVSKNFPVHEFIIYDGNTYYFSFIYVISPAFRWRCLLDRELHVFCTALKAW